MEKQKKTDAEMAHEELMSEIRALGEKLGTEKYRARTYKDDVELMITGKEFAMSTYSLNLINKKLDQGLEALEGLYKFYSSVSDMLMLAQRDQMNIHVRNIDEGNTISESEQKTDEAEKSTKVVKLKTGK